MKKLFIANRGDVQKRVAMTAHRMGIQMVVIKESSSPPLWHNDYDVEVVSGISSSASLYLNGPALIEYALKASCDAVHPGWGFLAEDHEFAQQCIDAGLIWVGPSPHTMKLCASKSAAKSCAHACGIPIISGSNQPLIYPKDLKAMIQVADDVGYPVVVKSVGGGGGRSLHVAQNLADLKTVCQRSCEQGQSYFGDKRLLIEAYYPQARHIEIQIIRDQHDHVMSLGSRDGSVQRRYQKFLEECPAYPQDSVDEDTFDQLINTLSDQACKLAQSCDYHGLGTVEFLVCKARDGDRSYKGYFLEINARLQVEHPVTEQVWGVDLVQWQLAIAAGESIKSMIDTEAHPRTTHSIQARVYAEDPHQVFRPTEGFICLMMSRAQMLGQLSPSYGSGGHIRYDMALESGSCIHPDFDPLLGKVIATAPTRMCAREALRHALSELIYMGPQTNQSFLMSLLTHSSLQHSQVSTDFVETNLAALLDFDHQNTKTAHEYLDKIGAILNQIKGNQYKRSSLSPRDQKMVEVFSAAEGVECEMGDFFTAVEGYFDYQGQLGQQDVRYGVITQKTWCALGGDCENSEDYYVDLDMIVLGLSACELWLLVRTQQGWMAQKTLSSLLNDQSFQDRNQDEWMDGQPSLVGVDRPLTSHLKMTSPLSGRVLDCVSPHTHPVITADMMCVSIESMKMETHLSVAEFIHPDDKACDWQVKSVHCERGDQIHKGDLLMVLEKVKPNHHTQM